MKQLHFLIVHDYSFFMAAYLGWLSGIIFIDDDHKTPRLQEEQQRRLKTFSFTSFPSFSVRDSMIPFQLLIVIEWSLLVLIKVNNK